MRQRMGQFDGNDINDSLATNRQANLSAGPSPMFHLPTPSFVYCDIAGTQGNSHTGITDAALLKAAGFKVRHNFMSIEASLRILDSHIDPSLGPPRLLVHPRCKRLIEALQAYQWAEGMPRHPLKDGVHDHPIDALRYAIAGHLGGFGQTKVRQY